MPLSDDERSDDERRALVQRIIARPDLYADLLLKLLDRVEALEWAALGNHLRADDPTVQANTDYDLRERLDL